MRKRVQLFIHHWYDTIKLVLLVVIVALVLLGLVANQNANAESSKQRGEAVLEIVETIKAENIKQTDIINRQFQALCFLLVETSGEEALKKLDPPLEQQCLDLANELRAQERQEEVARREAQSEQREVATSQPAPSPQQTASPAPRTFNPQGRPVPPQQPEPGLGPLLQPSLDALLKALRFTR